MYNREKLRFSQILLGIAAIFSALMAGLFGWLYLALYWPYRDKFNELGRYFDEEATVVYHEDASAFLCPTLFFTLLTLLIVALWMKRRRRATAQHDKQQ